MTALKTILACLALIAIVPLMVWAGSGSWRHALHALREYGKAMAWLTVPAVVVALFMVAAEHI